MLSESMRATQAACMRPLPEQGRYLASSYKINDRLLYLGIVWTIIERTTQSEADQPLRIRLIAKGPAPTYDHIMLDREPNTPLMGQRFLLP